MPKNEDAADHPGGNPTNPDDSWPRGPARALAVAILTAAGLLILVAGPVVAVGFAAVIRAVAQALPRLLTGTGDG